MRWERASVICTICIYEKKTQRNLVQTTHSRVIFCTMGTCVCDVYAKYLRKKQTRKTSCRRRTHEQFFYEMNFFSRNCDAHAFFFNRKARHIFVCLNHEEIFDAEGTRNPWLSSSRRIHHVFTNSRGQETYAISQRTNLFWTDVEYTCTRHLPLLLTDKKKQFLMRTELQIEDFHWLLFDSCQSMPEFTLFGK